MYSPKLNPMLPLVTASVHSGDTKGQTERKQEVGRHSLTGSPILIRDSESESEMETETEPESEPEPEGSLATETPPVITSSQSVSQSVSQSCINEITYSV